MPHYFDLTDNMQYRQCKKLPELLNMGDQVPAERREEYDKIKEDLRKYAWRSLKNLHGDKALSSQFIVFPRDIDAYGDDIKGTHLFDLQYGDRIQTGNLMGSFRIGDVQFSIGSRFDTEGKPYFQHYLLEKVLGIHAIDLQAGDNNDPLAELSVYLFPVALKQAVAKGLFKKYRHREYNDANIRGDIDVARHLRLNVPFSGRVAYSTREYLADNPVMQLVRHALEYIRSGRYRSVLTHDEDTKNAVTAVVAATPEYAKSARVRVINQNLRPVRHPYYSEYTFLQKLSLMILRHNRISHGEGRNDIAGVVFEGAWLWEEYVNKLLSGAFGSRLLHPLNKLRKDPVYIYKKANSPGKSPVYPDFILDRNSGEQISNCILDAKYKRVYWEDEAGDSHFGIQRDDRNQMIGYMYITKAKNGIFVCPMNEVERRVACQAKESELDASDNVYSAGELHGHGGRIFVVPFTVPQIDANCDYGKFRENMQSAEKDFQEKMLKIFPDKAQMATV